MASLSETYFDLLLLSLNQFIKCEKERKQNNYTIKFPPSYKVSRLTSSSTLSYNDCLILIHYLHLQQDLLERNGFSFYKLVLEDVIIIESSKENELMFAYMNSSHIKKINEKGEIIFMTPFQNNKGFIAPEILAVKSIPSRVCYKCFYYSLGLLVIHCINGIGTGTGTGTGTEREKEIIYEKSIENLKDTKLYWVLKRLIVNDPLKRLLLLV